MTRAIKILIWAYVILLLTEGALRKWILPGQSDLLLIVRDPVVVLIYGLALARGIFPRNGFIITTAALTLASVFSSSFAGQLNWVVIVYGIRINYFHLPLIWIMGRVLNRRDVERLGILLLLSAIPMTLVMVEQFRSPMTAWINKGVGGEEGGQIFGADGRIRPPGLFTFITGPQIYFPFCAAFFFDQLSGHGRMRWPFLVGCGIAIAIALPVSISRTVMLGTGVVGVVFLVTAVMLGGIGLKFLRPLILLGILGAVVTQLPVFHEGRTVFQIRWETAALESAGDGWADIGGRIITNIANSLDFARDATLWGRGIGVGSNVGARLLSGEMGFLLAEEEYGKIYGELGVLVGSAFILFRLFLTVYLGVRAIRALKEQRDSLPLLLFSATCVPLANGQWAPPVILGFSVVGAGLILGALNSVPDGAPAIKTPAPEPDANARKLPQPGLPVPSPLRIPVVPKPAPHAAPKRSNEDRRSR